MTKASVRRLVQALLFAVVCGSGGFARAADLDVEPLPPATAARQAAYLARAELLAEQKFGKRSLKYYAALRQAMVRLGAAHQAQARGDAASFESIPAEIAEPVLSEDEARRGALDSQTVEQIQRDFEAARTGARVVGGNIITTQAEFRDTVAFGKANALGCSGVVIKADAVTKKAHVLTAAHCVCSLGLLSGADNTKLYVGTNVSDPALFVALDFDNGVSMFPGSSCSGTSSNITDRDLAVVRFKNDKPQAAMRVATIAPAARLKDVLGKQTTLYRLVGFGYQRETNRFGVYQLGDIGQKAVGVIKRGADCTGNASSLPSGCLRDKEIILSDSGNRVDTCAGDSGGPVYVQNTNFTAFRLVAITSRSTSPLGACGPGGNYGLVDDKVIDWLRDAVSISVDVQD